MFEGGRGGAFLGKPQCRIRDLGVGRARGESYYLSGRWGGGGPGRKLAEK